MPNNTPKLRHAIATAKLKETIAELRKINVMLVKACEAKLDALKGKVYDPEAFDKAVELCETAIAKAKRIRA